MKENKKKIKKDKKSNKQDPGDKISTKNEKSKSHSKFTPLPTKLQAYKPAESSIGSWTTVEK